ncbi:unnamed protein product [Mytilus coruscus]|uniref:Fibrinogen C-terminal domain-containing protein n=1 Tax=Mytilus coruscus TaxID=42192 RepID=A0A6J8C756_MYTCO|nr:unnamed protein product [Mytilus coruscus]
MKDSVKKSNVCTSKKLTNHSGRKTAITRLLDEGMPVTAVQQHTGHKSLESINNYAKNSIKTQKKMCEILDKSNEKINRLTSSGKYRLRINLEDFSGNLAYAEYNNFLVGDASSEYKLTVSGYSGNAVYSLSYQDDSLTYHSGVGHSVQRMTIEETAQLQVGEVGGMVAVIILT